MSRSFLIPGFVDTHAHAPQYPMAGTCLDLDLFGWIDEYKLPEEMKYSDETYTHIAYRKAVVTWFNNRLVSKAQNVLYFTLNNTLYNAGNQ